MLPLAGTKRFYFKDRRPFFAMLQLFCLAMIVFGAFLYSLQRSEQELKALMDHCKLTWKAGFSLIQWRYGEVLEVLVSAG